MRHSVQSMKRSLSACVIAGASVVATMVGAGLAWADDASIALQGRGAKRDALSAMQYKPFDAELWGKLVGWTGGTALGPETIKGKPVLIVAWASWLKSSHQGLAIAQQMADKYSSMGLEVVCVHASRGYANAAKTAEDAKVKLRLAHDEKGEVFSALKIEGGGPDFYLVDRAGNLRFAQIDRKSVGDAVDRIVKETPAEAAQAKAPVPKPDSAEKDQAGAPSTAGGPWVQPPASAYAAAKWPAANRDVTTAKNVQGKPLPAKMGKETWITEKPAMEGRVVVLDFWATWCGPCVAASPILDDLQARNKDDLVIVGVSGQAAGNSREDVDTIKKFLARKPCKYSHANDPSQTIYKSLGVRAIPHVVVLSTDGIVRWQGNPHESEFRKVVDEVIKLDPGVKARKK